MLKLTEQLSWLIELLNVMQNLELPEIKQSELVVLEVEQLLSTRPEALEFLTLYGEYCHVMDDLVDEAVTPEMVDKSGLLRMKISLCEYWKKHQRHLWVVERLIHHTYFDCVKWERSTEEWKRTHAKALSHCSYNMLFAVLLLEFGSEVLQKYSLRFREFSHLRHINDTI